MENSTPSIISTIPELKSFLSTISSSNTLYLDLEGTDLCRNGTISIITILVLPEKSVKLIDVQVLGSNAFSTTTDDNKTLQSILEDKTIAKYIWDVRNDADALWGLYQVGLAGIIDIQLLENASRRGSKKFIRELDACVQYDLEMSYQAKQRWTQIKRQVKGLMSADKSKDVFVKRPMEQKTIDYCANDVVLLPGLRDVYMSRIRGDWLAKAEDASARRVLEVKAVVYDPHAPSKKFGPW